MMDTCAGGSIFPTPRARGVHHSGTSNQVLRHERLFGLLWARESAFIGMPSPIPEIVDNEAAQTAAASAADSNVEHPGQAAGGPAPSSSSGPALAAGGLAPEDVNMEVAAESSAVRTLEAENDASAKRQKVLAGMPILHESDVDVTVDAHKMVVLSAIVNSGPSGSLIGTRLLRTQEWNPA